MDYLRHALETSQRAPLPLILALAISSLIGAALLVGESNREVYHPSTDWQ